MYLKEVQDKIDMKKIILFVAFMLLNINVSFPQKEANIWYFGERAGLDFNSGVPVALTDGKMDTDEGCATISDKDGNLLFYTDGSIIWNKNHDIMDNGTGLSGHSSSTQSGVIVPMPGSDSKYYVFTVGARQSESNDDFSYSIVDMTLAGGLGSVVEKNEFLFTNSTEKITALRHRSCTNIWIIGHEWNNNTFRAYLLTENGIEDEPVLSHSGLDHMPRYGDNKNKRGYLKASPDGKKIAMALFDDGKFQVFDFDDETGEISNPITLYKSGFDNAYGLEFSPDGSKIYVNVYDESDFIFFYLYHLYIYQFDLQAGSEMNILNSAVLVYDESFTNVLVRYEKTLGAMQVGPDMKIYVARFNENKLGVINKPNELGKNCDYKADGVNLKSGNSMWGLPTFIQSYFYENTAVWLPDTIAHLGDNDFRIPVYAVSSCGSTNSFSLSFSLEIRFNAMLFYPDSASVGKIVDRYIDNGDQVVVIEGERALVGPDTSIVTELIGRPLLADTTETELKLAAFSWSSNQVDIELSDGNLSVEGECEPTKRFVTVNEPSKISITPNPAKSDITINIESEEKGVFQLLIYSVNGSEIENVEWRYFEAGSFEKAIRFCASEYSNGVYMALLKSPAGIISKGFSITK